VKHDVEARVFTLTIWREVPGRAVPARWPFIRHVDTWRRCCLSLRQVEAVCLSGDPWSPILILSKVECDSPNREVVIWECMDQMKISLKVEAFEGNLEDTGEVASDSDVGIRVGRWPFAWPS
jgi:hypothetical protein